MALSASRLWNLAIRNLANLRRPYGFDASESDTGLYGTLFGRDSLWILIFLLEAERLLGNQQFTEWVYSSARDVLGALAEHQSSRLCDRIEAQPGKIVHEYRERSDSRLRSMSIQFEEGRSYAGFDQTFLFIVASCIAAERFGIEVIGGDTKQVCDALQWVDSYGDEDGDGLFEYRRRCAKNLLNQTWRDSFDAMVSTGEDVALPPVAWLCVQSYAYKAWHAAAALFDKTGSASSADILRAKARALAARVSESFWLDSEGCFAAGLDGAKRAIPMITSDCGHALWSGIAPSQHVAPIVRRVHRPDLMTSYGCRTLSSSSPFFAPFSYHRGNVWPFDNAILTMGLMNNGYEAEARALIKRVSAAIEKLGSPYELYVVLDRELFLQPRLRREHALLLRRPNQENRNMGWTAAGLAYMAAALASIQGTRLAFRDGYLRA